MRNTERFARYLAEGFGCADDCTVPVWRVDSPASFSDQQLADIRNSLLELPAGLLVSPADLQQTLAHNKLQVAFAGRTREEPGAQQEFVAVLENDRTPSPEASPGDFRVVAFMPVYNEADIIAHSLEYLLKQGIAVYVIDNWSDDGTFEIAKERLHHGLAGLERFPASGPLQTYEWRSILRRVEELSTQVEADWFVLHDADERRHSPWRGVGLKDGLYHADRCGFNCIDHMVLNYWPTDNSFDRAHDLEPQFRYFTFSDHPGHFHQRRAWKNVRCPISLAPTAGHDIRFPGRVVYPYKFLLKHYPIRSQAHGQRKVLRERAARWSAEERSVGWHQQYDEVQSTAVFLRDPADLLCFDKDRFYEDYLIERLSGIGVFEQPPWWATAPR